jgi:UPF0176 protein
MTEIRVAALYHFARLDDYRELQAPLLEKCLAEDIRGTLLLAEEGINGTIAGTAKGVANVLAYIRSDPRLSKLVHKESCADEPPFLRMKVRLKKEIVSMGVPGIDPNHIVGTYVKPGDWNELISDPDVLVVDTRNDYEVEIGTFENSIDPQTTSFRQFPDWVKNNDKILGHKKIAMFCTGGIRCEKSTAYMKSQGYDEVFHLEGGILKYLETIPEEDSLWQGECFVFDERVSVGHNLKAGTYDLCHACRHAISDEDKNSPLFEPGVSCPKCHGTTSAERKARFAERQKQMELARERGEVHLGSKPVSQLKKV